MKERDEENGIIIEGVKLDYSERIRELQSALNEQKIGYET
jgi:hypothetical protein